MYWSALRKERILVPVLVAQAGYQLQQKAPARKLWSSLRTQTLLKIEVEFGIKLFQIMNNHYKQSHWKNITE